MDITELLALLVQGMLTGLFHSPFTPVVVVLLVAWAAALAASATGANDDTIEEWDNGLVTYGD